MKLREATPELMSLRVEPIDIHQKIRELMKHVTVQVLADVCDRPLGTVQHWVTYGRRTQYEETATILALHQHFYLEAR